MPPARAGRGLIPGTVGFMIPTRRRRDGSRNAPLAGAPPPAHQLDLAASPGLGSAEAAAKIFVTDRWPARPAWGPDARPHRPPARESRPSRAAEVFPTPTAASPARRVFRLALAGVALALRDAGIERAAAIAARPPTVAWDRPDYLPPSAKPPACQPAIVRSRFRTSFRRSRDPLRPDWPTVIVSDEEGSGAAALKQRWITCRGGGTALPASATWPARSCRRRELWGVFRSEADRR
jgi:hypothetical protein